MADQNIVRFTDSLSGSVDKLFRTGGFALAFGFAGEGVGRGRKGSRKGSSLVVFLLIRALLYRLTSS